MDLETLERRWREAALVQPPSLREGPVMRMIEARTADLRRDVRRRLRREAGYYLPMVLVSVAGLLSGITPNRVLAACAVAAVLGAVVVTLWSAERRIEDTPLDRSLREAITRLIAQLDAAGRAYVAVYVLVFVVAASGLTGAVWWRQGFGLALAGAVALSLVAVLWSVSSGRAYVSRMFRRHRAELAEFLAELEG